MNVSTSLMGPLTFLPFTTTTSEAPARRSRSKNTPFLIAVPICI